MLSQRNFFCCEGGLEGTDMKMSNNVGLLWWMS